MTNINPISLGITSNQYFKHESKEDLTRTNDKQAKQVPEGKKELESSTVLGFLAAQNTDLLPSKKTKTVDVAKYVTLEQSSRITDFMDGFESDFNEASNVALKEFPDLSQGAADTLALAFINSRYE